MGNYVNYHNVIEQMQAFGLLVDHLEVGRASTKRVKVDTAKCPVDREKWKTAGWYKLNDFTIDGTTYIVGSFGYWKGSENNAQKVEWKKEWVDNLTPEQKQAMADAHRASIKKAEEERKREIEYCANQAQTNWLKLKTTGESGYLVKKQVGAFGVKYHPKKDMTVVPVQDSKGKLFALQLIRHGLKEGSKIPAKQFWPRGAEIKGHFHVIGTLAGAKTIFIAEGYATAASIHQATNAPVVVAFNANNLTPVTKEIAKAHKYAKLIVCADDDYLTDGNPGVTQAQNAALSIGGEWIKPDFVVAGIDIRNGEKFTDFNDLHTHPQGGLHLVSHQLAQYLAEATQKPASATSAGANNKGSGVESSARATLSIEEITQRFVYVDDAFGDHAFDREKKKLVKLKKVQAMLPAHVRWDQVKSLPTWKAVHDYEIGFDPTEKDKKVKLNTFTGWPMQPEKGQCDKLLELLWTLCSAESNGVELYEWVLKWLAYPLQNPGAKMKSCIVIHGPQGTGKNLFFEAYADIYGEYAETIGQSALEDKFNSDWASRKMFIIANEVVASSDKYHLKNPLKVIITDKRNRINPKNLPAYSESNHMNLVFLSNEYQPVVLENDDRRHCVIWTPPAKDQRFYDAVADERDNGGVQALYQTLLEVDLTDFKPDTKPPMTLSKEQLMLLGSDNIQVFFDDWKAGLLRVPVCPVRSNDLFQFYKSWCLKIGSRPREQKYFVAYIQKMEGWFIGVKNTFPDNDSSKRKSVRVVIPSVGFFDEAIELKADVLTKEASETDMAWVGRCINEFKNEASGIE